MNTTSSNSTPNGQNGSGSVSAPSVEQKEKKKIDEKKEDKEQKKNDDKKEDKELHEPAEISETCDGKVKDKVCHTGTLTACILSFEGDDLYFLLFLFISIGNGHHPISKFDLSSDLFCISF